jgi:uncharacterized membrane protein
MMIKVKEIWISLRSSFWFVPVLIVLFSIAMALTLIELDSLYSFNWMQNYPRLFGAGAEASRGMLSTIASSIMSMMTVTFSMTLVTLALASSQYTSRILHNFMRSPLTQIVLGIFAGIFTYCLIILRTIRGGEGDEFIPSLAILMGFLLSVGGVGVLVLFIHHIASSIQASSIISSAATETIKTINKLFPEEMGHEKEKLESLEATTFLRSINAVSSGYIQSVDEEELIDMACEWDKVIKMNYGIGDFVVEGTPLVFVSGSELDGEKENRLRAAYSIKRNRSIEQDPLYGIRQIVDVALKALSPGVNDTTTGVMCINYLSSILSQLAKKRIPSINRYKDNSLRIIAVAPNFEVFLHASFDQIINNAKGNVAVIENLLSAIETINYFTTDPVRLHSLATETLKISEIFSNSIENSFDKIELQIKLNRLTEKFQLS